jgi:hypothetical protein
LTIYHPHLFSASLHLIILKDINPFNRPQFTVVKLVSSGGLMPDFNTLNPSGGIREIDSTSQFPSDGEDGDKTLVNGKLFVYNGKAEKWLSEGIYMDGNISTNVYIDESMGDSIQLKTSSEKEIEIPDGNISTNVYIDELMGDSIQLKTSSEKEIEMPDGYTSI